MELLVLINRYSPLLISFAATVAFTLFLPHLWAILMIIISGGLALTGVMDLAQPEHSVRRNYPLVGRLRWIFESVRPAIRQYLVEGDQEQTPFSRRQRSLVYARAKNKISDLPFGKLADVDSNGEAINTNTQ